MSESSEIPEGVELTNAERVKAVLATLQSNRDVQIDTVATAAGLALVPFIGVHGGIVAGFLGNILRPALAPLENASSAQEKQSISKHDLRLGIQILQEAWRTGEPQLTPKYIPVKK